MTDDLLESLKQALIEGHRQSVEAPNDALDKLFARIIVELKGDGVAAAILASKLNNYFRLTTSRK